MSDELGHLVAGQHKAGRGREALLQLLGPAFVGRHLRIHWNKGDNYDKGEEKGRLLTSKEVGGGRNSGKYLRSGRITTSRSRAQSMRGSSSSRRREWSAKHIKVREELAVQAEAALAKVHPEEREAVEEQLRRGLERALANAEMQYRWQF